MIPILFRAEADPEALLDLNGIELFDVDDVQLTARPSRSLMRDFSTYGVGALSDATACEVYEERNGQYELTLRYPLNGRYYTDIELRSIILAKPNYSDDPQAFRVYFISTPIEGIVEVYARHISYDLSGIPVLPFTAASCGDACQGLMNNAVISSPFTINTQVSTIADFEADVPASIRSWFGGKQGSLLDVYGGEWHYNNYTATLKRERGTNRGVTIQYGKNLLDFAQEQNCENVYTGVLPYWTDFNGNQARGNVVYVNGSFNYQKILCLDLSTDFDDKPTAEQLNQRAERYITENKIGVPKVSITLDWVQISELFDRVDLCDTVTVRFDKIGVATTAKCISTTWDALEERYSRIEIGEAKTTLADTVYDLVVEAEKQKTSVTEPMLMAIQNATELITGNKGGHVVMHTDDNGVPTEILIMDTDDIETATKVWRWNLSGLGYSNSGYNGTYGTAITMDGAIVADYITAGVLRGIEITNGNGSFRVDTNGNVTASKMAITGGYINLDTENVSQGLKLRNTAGTIYTNHSAGTRTRYSNNSLVLQEVGGAIAATSFNNISDRRLKNILSEDVPDVSQIRAVRFTWKDGRDDLDHIGYIAQEVEAVAPDMVVEMEDGTKSLDYIQLLAAKIENLEQRLRLHEDDGR